MMWKAIKTGIIGGLVLIAFMAYAISQSEPSKSASSTPSRLPAATGPKQQGLTADEVKQLGQFTHFSGKKMQKAISQSSTNNPAHDLLMTKSDSEKAQVLAQLLEQSHKPCGYGMQSFFQGLDQSGQAYWNLHCSNGRDYGIMIQPDAEGSTKLISCDILQSVGVKCFKKFDSTG